MRNQVQLIAYADRFGGSLRGLAALLRGPLAGMFGGVHVLPFFLPYDGADAGFDPVDHLRVDPRLGDWDDVRDLAAVAETVVDVIVNHVSADSAQFRDVLLRGAASPYAGMFLTFGRVFPAGATEQDLARIVRPRPGLPFTPVSLGGARRLVWTTFTSRQVDLDASQPKTRRYLSAVLERLAASRVTTVRLDAVGYTVKTPGSTCFMTPQTVAYVTELASRARRLGLQVLTEVHAHYRYAVQMAGLVDWYYDFAMPPLVLHALFTGESRWLLDWLAMRPPNAVTVLDTHDGIGMVDVAPGQSPPGQFAPGQFSPGQSPPGQFAPGLLPAGEVTALVDRIYQNSGGTSRLSTGAGLSAGGVYQVNCTLYDALGRDDRRYLLARLIQMFTPGIPQVYYVGLLAGGNDLDLAARTGEAREVNRHRYTPAEVGEALQRPVVRSLQRLIRFRSIHPAFSGEFSVLDAPAGVVDLRWQAGPERARLTARLADGSCELAFTADGVPRTVADPADLPY